MSHEDRRDSDSYISSNFKIIRKAVNEIGFPILVCIWMGYQQYMDKKESSSERKERTQVMNEFRDAIRSLDTSVKQQTRILRHKYTDD